MVIQNGWRFDLSHTFIITFVPLFGNIRLDVAIVMTLSSASTFVNDDSKEIIDVRHLFRSW